MTYQQGRDLHEDAVVKLLSLYDPDQAPRLFVGDLLTRARLEGQKPSPSTNYPSGGSRLCGS